MKKKNIRNRLLDVVLTAAVVALVAVAILRKDLLTYPWVSWPLVAIIAFVGGMHLQNRFNRTLIKDLSTSQAKTKRENSKLSNKVTVLTAQRDRLQASLNQYVDAERGRDIMSTAKNFGTTTKTIDIPLEENSLEDIPNEEAEEDSEEQTKRDDTEVINDT